MLPGRGKENIKYLIPLLGIEPTTIAFTVTPPSPNSKLPFYLNKYVLQVKYFTQAVNAGNVISPYDAIFPPYITYEAGADALYTLAAVGKKFCILYENFGLI